MKTLTFFFAMMLPVLARIGESEDQCDTRYGKPSFGKELNVRLYTKAGLELGVIFRGGKAGILFVNHSEKDILNTPKELSETEIETLLKANSGGVEWKKSNVGGFMKKSWETEDGKILAAYDPLKQSAYDHDQGGNGSSKG